VQGGSGVFVITPLLPGTPPYSRPLSPFSISQSLHRSLVAHAFNSADAAAHLRTPALLEGETVLRMLDGDGAAVPDATANAAAASWRRPFMSHALLRPALLSTYAQAASGIGHIQEAVAAALCAIEPSAPTGDAAASLPSAPSVPAPSLPLVALGVVTEGSPASAVLASLSPPLHAVGADIGDGLAAFGGRFIVPSALLSASACGGVVLVLGVQLDGAAVLPPAAAAASARGLFTPQGASSALFRLPPTGCGSGRLVPTDGLTWDALVSFFHTRQARLLARDRRRAFRRSGAVSEAPPLLLHAAVTAHALASAHEAWGRTAWTEQQRQRQQSAAAGGTAAAASSLPSASPRRGSSRPTLLPVIASSGGGAHGNSSIRLPGVSEEGGDVAGRSGRAHTSSSAASAGLLEPSLEASGPQRGGQGQQQGQQQQQQQPVGFFRRVGQTLFHGKAPGESTKSAGTGPSGGNSSTPAKPPLASRAAQSPPGAAGSSASAGGAGMSFMRSLLSPRATAPPSSTSASAALGDHGGVGLAPITVSEEEAGGDTAAAADGHAAAPASSSAHPQSLRRRSLQQAQAGPQGMLSSPGRGAWGPVDEPPAATLGAWDEPSLVDAAVLMALVPLPPSAEDAAAEGEEQEGDAAATLAPTGFLSSAVSSSAFVAAQLPGRLGTAGSRYLHRPTGSGGAPPVGPNASPPLASTNPGRSSIPSLPRGAPVSAAAVSSKPPPQKAAKASAVTAAAGRKKGGIATSSTSAGDKKGAPSSSFLDAAVHFELVRLGGLRVGWASYRSDPGASDLLTGSGVRRGTFLCLEGLAFVLHERT
jgi:hypothetical protein